MKVRVYGLPRTGTNFLEYLIRHNTNCEYVNEYGANTYLKERTAIKHCAPQDDGKDLYIIIVKNKDNFTQSFRKWCKNKVKDIDALYENASDDYIKFYEANKDKTIILSYEQLLGNEVKFMEHLRDNYNVKINEKIDIPVKRMNRSGGKGVTSENFDKSKINNTFDKDSKIYPYLLKLDE